MVYTIQYTPYTVFAFTCVTSERRVPHRSCSSSSSRLHTTTLRYVQRSRITFVIFFSIYFVFRARPSSSASPRLVVSRPVVLLLRRCLPSARTPLNVNNRSTRAAEFPFLWSRRVHTRFFSSLKNLVRRANIHHRLQPPSPLCASCTCPPAATTTDENNIDMEKRIELEKRGRKPEEIDQLILDDCRSTTIVGLTDEYVGLRSLSLINVGLTSLKGFPKLPLLLYLDVSENRISNSLQNLSGCIKLKSLNLCQNKLKDLEAIEPLKSLEHLRFLDLSSNEVTKQEGYKEFILEQFSDTLRCLDGDSLVNGLNESDSDSEDDEEDGSESEAEEEEGDGDGEGEGEGDGDGDGDSDSDDYDSDDQIYETGGVGLEEMLKDNIDEESEGNDYVLDEEDGVDQDSSDESDDDAGEGDDSTANESQDTRGKKRKLDDEPTE